MKHTFIFSCFLCIACFSPKNKETNLVASQFFTISKQDSVTTINVIIPTRDTLMYLLRNGRLKTKTADFELSLPIESYVALSTSHLGFLEALSEEEKLLGFPNLNMIYSEKIRRRVQQKKVKNTGSDSFTDVEKIISLNPDLVFDYYNPANNKIHRLLEQSGIPVILINEYSEETPLSKTSWIHVFAPFFKKEKKADSIMKSIKYEYEKLHSLIKSKTKRPKVMAGIMYGDIWYMPGGKSFSARYFKDAGAHYLWDDSDSQGAINISFEEVLGRANKADYWLNASDFSDLNALSMSNKHYQLFNSFKEKNVYAYTNRKKGKSNDYFESGALRSDLVLKDLIKIIHPSVLPNSELYYYKRLQ